MSETAAPRSSNQKPSPAPGAFDFVVSLLASLKFSLSVVVLIALACIAGTVIPQAGQIETYLQRHPDAHGLLRALAALGLTHVFTTWWFLLLLGLLAASLVVCTARRFVLIPRTQGAVRARVIGSFITHVSLLLVLAGGVMRVLWAQKGMIEFREGETVSRVMGADPAGMFELPFSIRLVDFTLEYYADKGALPADGFGKLVVQWPEKQLKAVLPTVVGAKHSLAEPGAPEGTAPAFVVTVLRYVPDFSLDSGAGEVTTRSQLPNNPALQVAVSDGKGTNTQWVFAKFPDFGAHGGVEGASPLIFRFEMAATADPRTRGRAIKAFRSSVELLESGKVVLTKTVAVNAPLSYRGFTFYQTNYDPNDLSWSALQVVRDPGVPVVYTGFVLMMVGLTIVFCVGPWLESQRQASGGTP